MNRLRALPSALLLIVSIFLPVSSVPAKDRPSYTVEVADIEKSADLLKALKSKGITAVLFPRNAQVLDEQTNCAVWIGRNVPLDLVRTALLEAIKIYPRLRYFHLVGDRGESPPEKVHNTIHIGGSMDAAQAMELRAFDRDEIRKALLPMKSIQELHSYLRRMNRLPEPAAS